MLRQLPFLLAFAAAALALPPFGGRVARDLRRLSRPLVAHPARGIALIFVLALALAASVSLLVFMPLPRIADEFSHLLAADTFRHGRLTNPPHPAWMSFETFHVLQQPTYMARYSPAPDLFLALGWVATGMPIAGAWLGYALACAAVAWALIAFVPRRWALTGGLLLAVHPAMFAWSQSYWGGSVAVLGGALLAGCAGRLVRRNDSRASLLGGVGLFLLANSRPFEGFAFAVIVLGWLVVARVRRFGRAPARHATLLPLALLGCATLAFVAFYDSRVTGDPLMLPHRAYGRQYAPSPLFVGGTPSAPPHYRHEVMKSYHLGGEMDAWRLQATGRGKLFALWGKFVLLAEETFSLPFALLPARAPAYSWLPVVALAGLPLSLGRSSKTRAVAVLLAAFVAAASLVLWMQPQYAAPGVCLAVLLVVSSMRAIGARWRRSSLPSVLFLAFFVLIVSSLAASVAMIPGLYTGPFAGAVVRDRIIRQLESLPGRDVVIVRYGPGHYVHFEWVYNDADIDRSEVVWARDASPEINMELLRHMKGRRVWLLEADARPPRLREVRFGGGLASGASSR
ncbi:MAG: hypothetical protein WC538_10820 [Thermoanaerobaculia bacterium]|jgi:hypothetical protein